MTMRKFSMVRPQLWRKPAFLNLNSSDARLLYLYFVSGPHQTMAGSCYISDGYVCDDLGWDAGTYKGARAGLEAAGLIVFDPATSEFYIRNWFEDLPGLSEKHVTGARRILAQLGSDMIRQVASDELNARYLPQPNADVLGGPMETTTANMLRPGGAVTTLHPVSRRAVTDAAELLSKLPRTTERF